MELFFITNDAEEARVAEEAGIDRIFIDLESDGKAARQGKHDTFISSHAMQDIRPIREKVKKASIMVRINPVCGKTEYEINQAIEAGADWIMLPMFTEVGQIMKVVRSIRGRVKFVALVETASAMARIDEIAGISGVDEIHIGLNDLSISLGLSFLFEPLACGLIDWIAAKLNSHGIAWGFGGTARVGQGMIPAELILSEHVRLNSSRVILSRAFRKQPEETDFDLTHEVTQIRRYIEQCRGFTHEQMQQNSALATTQIRGVIASLQKCAVVN